jgi:hypothetical protein
LNKADLFKIFEERPNELDLVIVDVIDLALQKYELQVEMDVATDTLLDVLHNARATASARIDSYRSAQASTEGVFRFTAATNLKNNIQAIKGLSPRGIKKARHASVAEVQLTPLTPAQEFGGAGLDTSLRQQRLQSSGGAGKKNAVAPRVQEPRRQPLNIPSSSSSIAKVWPDSTPSRVSLASASGSQRPQRVVAPKVRTVFLHPVHAFRPR